MEQRAPVIVIADSDDDDRLLLKLAFEGCRKGVTVHLVKDGEELMDYLHRRGSHAGSLSGDLPDLIILNPHMPMRDGFEVIEEIKADLELKRIPLLAYTAVCSDENINRCYALGVNTVIDKNNIFDKLDETAESIYNYWFK
jgi:CheY-like chemotaxis protein